MDPRIEIVIKLMNDNLGSSMPFLGVDSDTRGEHAGRKWLDQGPHVGSPRAVQIRVTAATDEPVIFRKLRRVRLDIV
jgi:hypothetical protein